MTPGNNAPIAPAAWASASTASPSRSPGAANIRDVILFPTLRPETGAPAESK